MKLLKILKNYFSKEKAIVFDMEGHLENLVKNILYDSIEEFKKNENKIYNLFNIYPNNPYGHFGMAAYSLLSDAYPAAISHIECGLKIKENEDGITLKTEILYSALLADPNIIIFNLIKDHKNPVDFVKEFINESLEMYPNNEIIKSCVDEFNKKFRGNKEKLKSLRLLKNDS